MTTWSYPPSAEDLRIYVILHLQEPPRLLINKPGSKQFYCYFGLPLPQQMVIFRLGKSTSSGYRSAISIEVSLDCEASPFLVGYLDNNVHSVCYQPKWSKDFLCRSHVLHEKDRMAKLLLTIQECKKNVYGFYETRQLVVGLSRDLIAPFPIKINSTCEQPRKKLKKLCPNEAIQRRTTESPSVDCNNNQDNISSLKYPPDKCITDLTPAPSPAFSTESTLSSNKKINWPSSRWGHTACVTNENQLVVIGGQGEDYQLVKDSFCVLDCGSKTWRYNLPQNVANRRMGHSSTFDPIKNVIYIYGGCKYKKWLSDVNVLDLDTWKWSIIKFKEVGSALKRAYHASALFQGKILVLGGVYPKPHPQPDGCSNDLHMFSPETSSWSEQKVSGTKPPPCSGHSLEIYDEDKAVIFGGWDASVHCYNDVFLLNLGVMEYSKPDVVGIKPACRTWHSSNLLAGHRLLVHGGFNGKTHEVLEDSFIFCIDNLTWLAVNTTPKIRPCVGHVMFSSSKDNGEDKIMVFGGGDNRGNFYNDLSTVDTFTETKL